MVQSGDRGKLVGSPGTRRQSSVALAKGAVDDVGRARETAEGEMDSSIRSSKQRGRPPTSHRLASPSTTPSEDQPSTSGATPRSTQPRPVQAQSSSTVSASRDSPPPPIAVPEPHEASTTGSSTTPMPPTTTSISLAADTSRSSTPLAAKPPLPRIPVFPLVDSYVPDPNSTDRRHPRQLVPKDLGFPTVEMEGKIRKEDLDDRLLMATCAVLHRHQNRALCPKEVAEVMLEQAWLKNAGTTPFAHVSTCIRSHIARAASAAPPYLPLLVPFELVGALTAEEVRAVGLHAEQRPAVKRGTLWYLNPQVFGPGIGADDPFVRCRREVGMAGSDQNGLYVRGLVPLQASHPSIPPPGLRLSSTLYHSNGADEDGDEEGMGRGKRKRRASSAMMAAMSTDPSSPHASIAANTVSSSAPAIAPSPVAINVQKPSNSNSSSTIGTRRTASFAPASAPVRSTLPKLKLRLTSLEEVESDVVDSDGHVGEAATRRRKSKKKVRRAGSEGVSRAGSVEPNAMIDDEVTPTTTNPTKPRSRSSTFSTASSSALLAQSLLAASASAASSRSDRADSIAPVVSPDELSLTNASINLPHTRSSSTSATPALHVSMSAPNIFSHHFASAPSPPDLMDHDSSSDTARNNSQATSVVNAPSPSRSDSTDEADFHEAMLRGDDFDFEWGADSYTTGSSSVVSNSADLPYQHSPLPVGLVLPLLSSKQRGKLPDAGPDDAVSTIEDPAIDTPATTPRNPDDLDMDEKEGVKGVDEKKSGESSDREKLEEGPLGKISRVGMQATLCGAMHARQESTDDDDDVVVVEKDTVKQEIPTGIPLASFTHDIPARQRQPSLLRLTSDIAGVSVPLPSPLSLDLSPMLPMANTFAATEFDFVGDDEEEDDFDRSSVVRASSFDHADSADDEDEDEDDGDREDDTVAVKVEDDDSHFTTVSHPSSRASSTYPLDAFDRDLLLRATSMGASSNSSEGSDSFDPMLVVSSSILATGLPVPQQAPSPPETTDWNMNVDFDEIDGELGTHVDLLAPESIGLEELDLAWAGEDEDDPTAFVASPKNPDVRTDFTSPSRTLSGCSNSSAPGNAFLTGSAAPKFPSAFPSPLTRRPSFMSELGKGQPTVAHQAQPADETQPTSSRRTSGRKTSLKVDDATVDFVASGDNDKGEDAEDDDADEEEEEEEETVELVPTPKRRTRKSQPAATVSPRKSSRRTSTTTTK